jgi:hypothetical protein
MRRVILVPTAAIGLAILCPTSAAATDRFDGTCKLTGELRFDKPLGNQPRVTGFRDRAAGSCSGELNGSDRENLPVELRATGSGTLGCLAGQATSSGTLTFTAQNANIRFFTETSGGLTQFESRFRGAVSGEGLAEVNFLPYADQSTTAACQAGALDSARYDLTARTTSPLVG